MSNDIEARHETAMVRHRRVARTIAKEYAEARKRSVGAAADYMMRLNRKDSVTLEVLEALLEIVGEMEVGS